MLKVTTVNSKIGLESLPVPVEPNESGYILLPELPEGDDAYCIYAPFFDQPAGGPWYFLREVKRREARDARRTVVGLYKQRDLLPQLLPDGRVVALNQSEPFSFALPDPVSGQTHWMSYINGRPFAIIGCL